VRLGPDSQADEQATELSGGQEQGVALARSLAYNPDILLLDEPLASLDYVLRKRLQRELADLNEELDMTFIYVTHSLESALLMSDKLFVLDDGDIIQTGSPEEIYRQPNTKFIAEFMGDANVFELDGVERKNDSYEVQSSLFEQTTTVPYHHDYGEPRYLVVRYDDTAVGTELTEELGLEVEVENVLVRGNTVLIECGSPATDGEYVAEMPVDAFRATNIEKGDTAYLQWDSEKSILVPE
jgi:ABC-type Fe3+/spermidine/putrescine transport system ATPase subunit